jgi:adhesin transport system membrane fusion protein
LTTLGGVAQAGETLIEIVPLDDTLLVEAYVRPSDIAFLFPGQPVKVKITAYDFSRYGGIDGEITRIGADATRRPDREEQAFVVQVRTQTNILDADGAALEIIPGMVAEIDILAGTKTVLEYLTQPVIRVKDRALRE